MADLLQAFADARAKFEMARSDIGEVEAEIEYELLDKALTEAESELLRTPSPNLMALIYKLEVFRDEELFDLHRVKVIEILTDLIGDAYRLGASAG